MTSGAEPLDSVPIWVDVPGGSLESWRFKDDRGELSLSPRTIEEQDRTRLGFPREGTVRSLLVKVPGHTEKVIEIHAEYPWKSQGSIPLVAVPRNYLPRGTILIESPPEMQIRIETAGLRRLEPSTVKELTTDSDPNGPAGNRPNSASDNRATVEAFAYTESTARLNLTTEMLTPLLSTGIIREALLTTSFDVEGASLNRLRLLVSLAEERSAQTGHRPGITLIRIRRDGTDIHAVQSKSGILIPVSSSTPATRTTTIVMEYTVADSPLVDGARVRPILPRVELPCLSFVWEVVAPPAWSPIDSGPGLIDGDQKTDARSPLAALGLSRWPWRPAIEPGSSRGLGMARLARCPAPGCGHGRDDSCPMAWSLGFGAVAGRCRPARAQFGRLRIPIAMHPQSRPAGRSDIALLDPAPVWVDTGAVSERSLDHDRGGSVKPGTPRSIHRCDHGNHDLGLRSNRSISGASHAGAESFLPKSPRRPATRLTSESSCLPAGRRANSSDWDGQTLLVLFI